jgi:adenylate cyclase
MPAVRRLAAILAADVAGYSRLMGADEEGTHERLQAHRRELVQPKIGEHSGRIVNTAGDGILAEFPSVVDAMRCAAEWQLAMTDREAAIPEDRRMRFRIGINLGDVIVEDDDIFGDGVNVAARLEALAEPGGVCISRMVRDQIRDKLPYAFEDLGERNVKNIARPVRVYVLRPEAVTDPPAQSVPTASPIPQSAVAPRLSIVVLLFANLSNDPEQQYFADGITEDLTTDLSRITDMVVISRNTAFTYQGKRVDTKQVGRELNVRYVLEGSVRRSGSQIRVNAQLIDAEADAHLWAERFDGDISDLFVLQNEVTSRIAVALNFELVDAEAARPISDPDALDYILRGRAADLKTPSPETRAEAVSMYERALAFDPRSVEAQGRLANALVVRVLEHMTGSVAADTERAEVLIEQALAVSPRAYWPHRAKAQLLRAQGRCQEAIPEYEAAIAGMRTWAAGISHLGWCKFFAGLIEEAIPAQEQVIRLSPRDPNIGNVYWRIGLVHLVQSRIDDAILWLERARNAIPKNPFYRYSLTSAYALKGESARAAAEFSEARTQSADECFSSIARLKATGFWPGSSGYWGVPKIRALFETTFFAGLRLAGMPEE